LVGGLEQTYGGLQSSFEYLNSLPIINIHPELIQANIPWMDKEGLNSWLARNKEVLQSWKDVE
jgi:hypothetical protein